MQYLLKSQHNQLQNLYFHNIMLQIFPSRKQGYLISLNKLIKTLMVLFSNGNQYKTCTTALMVRYNFLTLSKCLMEYTLYTTYIYIAILTVLLQ